MTSCHTRTLPFSLVSLVLLLVAALASMPAYAAVLTVTNTNDSGAGSLRGQISAAAPGDSIEFNASLSGQTITLTSGEIVLDKNLTIDGSSLTQRVTVSGSNNSRIFFIGSVATISISSLRIVNGSSTTGGPGDFDGDGGAIHVRDGGSLSIDRSEIVDNQAEFNGGGIYIDFGGGATLTNNTFTGNNSTFAGGAVRSTGDTLPVRLEGNTFISNSSNEGSSFWASGGGEVVTNNTFADNTGDGTLYVWDTLELTNNTFLGNDGVTVRNANALLNMRNNIIGSCRPTGGGSIGVNDNNWIVNGDCSPANSGDPFLMPLSDNGGPTPTAALMTFSGAVNAATSSCPAADQRGVGRGATCDLGAYEVSPTDYSNQCHSGLVQGETYSFGATGIIVTVDTVGSLSELCATLEQSNHPNATAGLQTGRHWQVTPTAGGNDWSITMSAPATFAPDGDDRLCRYTGTGQVWECGSNAATSFTTNRITRSGIQQLSAWAVGTASYPVTAATGTGSGTITPASQLVDSGSNASFTVTPDPGWSVSSVSGDTCTPTNTTGSTWVASTITSACSVTANFAQDTFTVAAAVSAGQGGITPASQNVNSNGTANFTVTPDTGWSVDSVSGNSCSPTQVAGTSWEATNIQADCTVQASFVINSYTVGAAVGVGNGTITPPSQNVDHGSNATFTVTPDTGWSVSSVSGDTCTPTNTAGSTWVASTITSACSVTANFAQDTFTVTTSVTAGQGTITPPSQNVTFDGTASFTVTPDTGWSVDSVSGNTCTPVQVAGDNWEATNIQANCAVQASFVINSYTVAAAVGTGNGTITPPSQNVDHGSNATFTVTPDIGWSVTSVSGDTCSPVLDSGDQWIASGITESCSVTADFAEDTFTVTTSVAAGQGTITPPSQNVTFDGTASFTVTPDTGWSVDSVSGDTCTPAQIAGDNWEASSIQDDCTVQASFVINSYTVTAAVGTGNGTITPPSQNVDHGSAATFTVTPDAGWSVTSVSGDTCTPALDSGDQWIASGITEACVVTADFAEDVFAVTATVLTGQGTITPPSQNVTFDGTASFTVTPDTGWSVASVSGDTCTPAQIAGDNWEATNIQDDCSVQASFVINSYPVTASVSTGNGTITPPSQDVDHGSDASFTVSPETGWSLTSVSGDTCTPVLDTGDQWTATNITEACAVIADFEIDTYTIGGTVTGLGGGDLVLQNNGGDDLTISANGAFTFATAVDDLSNYEVTILTEPDGQVCSLANNMGTLAGSDVDDVAVSCADIELGLSLSDIEFSNLEPGETGQQQLTLTNVGQGELIIEEFTAPGLPFGFAPQDCAPLPRTLAAGESCSVMLSFQSPNPGEFQDELLITSNAMTSPNSVGLAGGAAQPALPVPTLSLPALLLLMLGMALVAVRRGNWRL